MTDQRLIDGLAVGVMGWTVAPDRFLMGRRRWIPRWRFQPTRKSLTMPSSCSRRPHPRTMPWEMTAEASGSASESERSSGKRVTDPRRGQL